ncbi:MAG: hypothetical protein LBD54_01600 [Puniceicoccales bacterium]|jgi:hypothetical protein|nr:hypothetical protein [Puniceicoccales bacterium]
MKSSIFPFPSKFFPVALALLAFGWLAEGTLEAWPYFKLPGEITVCCAPQDRTAFVGPESLTELADADTLPEQFSRRWRPQIKDVSTSFEFQWTQDYYQACLEGRQSLLDPVVSYHDVLRRISFPEGNVVDWQRRYDRLENDPNFRHSIQLIVLQDKEMELSFENFAGVDGYNEPFAVKLYGAEWLCPWDDREGSRVRSLPNGGLLRRASSAADLRKIRLTTLCTASTPSDGEEAKFSGFVVEIQGPGINSGDRTQYGSLLCVFLVAITPDAPVLRQEGAKLGTYTINLDVLDDILIHILEIHGLSALGPDESGDGSHSNDTDPDEGPDPSAGTRRRAADSDSADSDSAPSPDEDARQEDSETIRRLNAERSELTDRIQELRDENERLREDINRPFQAQKEQRAADQEAREQLAAQIQELHQKNRDLKARLRSVSRASTGADTYAEDPPTLQDEIEALEEQAKKLLNSLELAQSWRLCLDFQQAVKVIKEKMDKSGRYLVSKTEYKNLDSTNKRFLQFLISKSDLQKRRPEVKPATDWTALHQSLLDMIDPALLQLSFYFMGNNESPCWLSRDGFNQINENLEKILHLHPPSPVPTSYSLSEDDFKKLNTALEQLLIKLQEIGRADMRDTGE